MTNSFKETQEQEAQISIIAQYTKDLSFENPNAPNSLIIKETPEIDLNLDIIIQKIPEDNCYEVAIIINVETTYGNKQKMFIIDLTYAGIFSLINIPPDEHMAVLNIHCAAMLFPFARKIISDTTQYGGFQPLMIDPIDFARLFHQRLKNQEEKF